MVFRKDPLSKGDCFTVALRMLFYCFVLICFKNVPCLVSHLNASINSKCWGLTVVLSMSNLYIFLWGWHSFIIVGIVNPMIYMTDVYKKAFGVNNICNSVTNTELNLTVVPLTSAFCSSLHLHQMLQLHLCLRSVGVNTVVRAILMMTWELCSFGSAQGKQD